MTYKSAFAGLILLTFFLSACLSTRINEKPAWLSNEKVLGNISPVSNLTVISLPGDADKPVYLKAVASLQEKLQPVGVSLNSWFFTDAETVATAKAKAASDLRDYVLLLMPIKGITIPDEMNNPMLQKQLEFYVETKAGEKIAAGLISIDKESTTAKLADAIAGIVFNYMKDKKMLR